MRLYDGLQQIIPGAEWFLRPDLYLAVVVEPVRPTPWMWGEEVSYDPSHDLDTPQQSFDFMVDRPRENDEPVTLYDVIREYFGVLYVKE